MNNDCNFNIWAKGIIIIMTSDQHIWKSWELLIQLRMLTKPSKSREMYAESFQLLNKQNGNKIDAVGDTTRKYAMVTAYKVSFTADGWEKHTFVVILCVMFVWLLNKLRLLFIVLELNYLTCDH